MIQLVFAIVKTNLLMSSRIGWAVIEAEEFDENAAVGGCQHAHRHQRGYEEDKIRTV